MDGTPNIKSIKESFAFIIVLGLRDLMLSLVQVIKNIN